MTDEHLATQEEETFWRLREEAWDTLSEAARTVLTQAEGTASRTYGTKLLLPA